MLLVLQVVLLLDLLLLQVLLQQEQRLLLRLLLVLQERPWVRLLLALDWLVLLQRSRPLLWCLLLWWLQQQRVLLPLPVLAVAVQVHRRTPASKRKFIQFSLRHGCLSQALQLIQAVHV